MIFNVSSNRFPGLVIIETSEKRVPDPLDFRQIPDKFLFHFVCIVFHIQSCLADFMNTSNIFKDLLQVGAFFVLLFNVSCSNFLPHTHRVKIRIYLACAIHF